MSTVLHVLRVFCAADGRFGNPLGVFVDGGAVAPEERQAVAAQLGFSETVFVDDAARGVVRIFTPGVELPFAGHPLVGTAWLLARTGTPVETLRPPAGDVPTWSEGEVTWIRGRPEWAPAFELRRLASAAEVAAFENPGGDTLLGIWAWRDETAGRVRARVFPNQLGIPEDEATGAAAVRFGALLGRELEIHQGEGSTLYVRPGSDGTVAVGGRVALLTERAHPS